MKRWAGIIAVSLCTLLLLITIVGAAVLFPVSVAAQTPAPIGVFLNLQSTGSVGGDHTLVSIAEDGSATMAFFNLEDQLATVYRGVWLLDPYGTVTLELEVPAEASCSGEESVGTITFLPSPNTATLTAVHYPACLWGDGGLTLLRVADETIAQIEAFYASAGLMPGLVFQSDILVAADDAERQLTLNLGQSDQAMMVTETFDGEAPTVEYGEWAATVYTVTVTLTGTEDATYAEPDVLTFGFLKDGTGRMAAFEFDEEKYGEQGLLMTHTPQLPEMLAQAEAEAAPEIPGVYTSELLPAADSPGLVLTLALFDNGNALSTANYLNGEAPIVELGTWTDNEDGTLTLSITGTADEEYDEPSTPIFAVADDRLESDNIILTKLPVADLAMESAPVAYFQSDTLPAASSPGRVIELVFFDDGTAFMRTDFLNDEAPIDEIGVWEQADDTVTVTLLGRPDQEYDEAVVIVFADEGDQLVAVEYDESLYGTEGFVLYAQPLETLQITD